MAQNPYYIEPANIMPGLSAVASAIKGRGARELEAAKERKVLAREEQKETEAQAKREEGARLLESGTPDEIAAFMVKNPEAGKTLSGAMKFKSEETKQRLIDKVRGIYTGQLDPLGASIEHAESLIQEGADPSDTMELAKVSAQDPEMGREEAGRIWAGLAPDDFMKAQKAMGLGPAAETKDTRTTDIKNYEFAKEQGFKGSLLDFQVAGKDKDDKTTAIKEFEYGEKNPKFALQQKGKRDAAATKATAGKEFKNEMDLRKEFLSQSGEFQKVRDAYTRVVGSTQDPSPAGDLSLIFNYMKMLDPGSVVRESEFATAAAAGSYGERIQAGVQKVLSGERLSPNMRADFLKKSGTLMGGMQKQHKKREQSYGAIAEKNGLSRDDVVVDLNVPAEEEQTEAQTFTEGQTATGPGGEKIIYRNGNWEAM